MDKGNNAIATEVLRLLKEENEKSENKSRQAIKRIYFSFLQNFYVPNITYFYLVFKIFC